MRAIHTGGTPPLAFSGVPASIEADKYAITKGGGGVFADPDSTSKPKKGTFPAGSYAYFCFVRSPAGVPHYRLGMFGRMTVTG